MKLIDSTSNEDKYIVQMKGITKTFPGIVANDNVDLKIKKGEVFAILGENGAGKSTLMSMLFGMYEPDSGEIFIKGKKVEITSPKKATDLNIGMVHQHFKLVENFSITENIILGLEPIKKLGFVPYVNIKDSDKKIRDLSVQYGLEVEPTDIIENLQVSTRQRVEILKMLYREAEVLIFDEPTAVLTPQEIDFLLNIIKNLQSDGKTVILITHKLDEVKRVADRCAILYRGKLTYTLDVKDTSIQEMANLMVGRDLILETKKKKAEFGREVLTVKNLNVENQDKFLVVNDTSFSVREGEIFAIAGVSGNGQVEIADTIAGLRAIKSGEILFLDEDISKLTVRERTEKGITYIPEDRQNVGLIMDFVLADNLKLKSYYKDPFAKKGIINEEVTKKYGKKLIDDFDIRTANEEQTLTRYMSGGNQQKAIIAREISLDSKLIVFVQPTRGLDIGAISNIQNKMIEERDKGKAVLLISLELDEVMAMADTIGVIYNGKISKIASPDEITRKEIGEYMMGVGGSGKN